MKKILLIQPGKLGDIIICLPIAKFYHDKGYKVIWPIFHNFVQMMHDAVDYVEWVSVTNNVYNCVPEAYNIGQTYNPDKIIDIAATFPGSNCTKEYNKLGDGLKEEKFDAFKYRLAEVPFNQKWNLQYNRNLSAEDSLYINIVKSPIYDVYSTKHSRGQLNIKFESKGQLIEINENYSIFYWRKILEGASHIALVDSAMANFVEQINLSNKKILFRKEGHPEQTLRNDWIIKK